jgi:DNA-binding MarR family transcriptional regulator
MIPEKIVKRIERVFKGAANHNRIKILDFIATQNKTTLWQISQRLKLKFRNVSQHTDRLVKAGLIRKQPAGRQVWHFLTPYGRKVYEFMKTLKL